MIWTPTQTLKLLGSLRHLTFSGNFLFNKTVIYLPDTLEGNIQSLPKYTRTLYPFVLQKATLLEKFTKLTQQHWKLSFSIPWQSFYSLVYSHGPKLLPSSKSNIHLCSLTSVRVHLISHCIFDLFSLPLPSSTPEVYQFD